MVNVRFYQESDYTGVRNVLEKSGLYWDQADSEPMIKRRISVNPESILVAEEDDRVVGTLYIATDFVPFLFRLAVDPDYRQRGIGAALGGRGEAILREKGYDQVHISVDSENAELLKMYEKHGYEKGHTYVWMTKPL